MMMTGAQLEMRISLFLCWAVNTKSGCSVIMRARCGRYKFDNAFRIILHWPKYHGFTWEFSQYKCNVYVMQLSKMCWP